MINFLCQQIVLEDIRLKVKITALVLGLVTMISLTSCGSDPELTKFKTEMDNFCTSISEIDTSINNLDAESDNAINELLGYLDDLDE